MRIEAPTHERMAPTPPASHGRVGGGWGLRASQPLNFTGGPQLSPQVAEGCGAPTGAMRKPIIEMMEKTRTAMAMHLAELTGPGRSGFLPHMLACFLRLPAGAGARRGVGGGAGAPSVRGRERLTDERYAVRTLDKF